MIVYYIHIYIFGLPFPSLPHAVSKVHAKLQSSNKPSTLEKCVLEHATTWTRLKANRANHSKRDILFGQESCVTQRGKQRYNIEHEHCKISQQCSMLLFEQCPRVYPLHSSLKSIIISLSRHHQQKYLVASTTNLCLTSW